MTDSVVREQPRPGWTTLPRPGCEGVTARVLLRRGGILVANLRFAEHATIDEHAAGWDVDVVCVAGSGFTSIDGEVHAIRAGQTVLWPRDLAHRLWTEATEMETLMVERYGGSRTTTSGT